MDVTLSITDGAPKTITLDCGAEARLPGIMDYRVLSAVANAVPDFDEVDAGVMLVYCCLHAQPEAVAKLWKRARAPKKLYDDMVVWMAGVDADTLEKAITELDEYSHELDELTGPAGDGDEETTGKKKTTLQ